MLQNLEEKVFAGPVKIFQVFKAFDKDGDGFVSYADFEDHLNQLQIPASKKEVAAILKHLDKENKGFLDFRTFSTGIHQNMSSQINIPRNELHLPNLVPNKAKLGEITQKASSLQQAVNEARKTFQPDSEPSKSFFFNQLPHLINF